MTSSSYSDFTIEQMITQNNFSSSFSDQLRRLARNDPTLTELDLSYNVIGDTGAATIAHALLSNSTLIKLILSFDKISYTGKEAIIKALKLNSSLSKNTLTSNSKITSSASSSSS